MKITSKTINYTVETVEELSTIVGQENDVIVVTDGNRGGTFVYRSAEVGVNNGGTVFNGWTRQYSGAINVKWFGAKGDGITDDTEAFKSALLYSATIGATLNGDNISCRLTGYLEHDFGSYNVNIDNFNIILGNANEDIFVLYITTTGDVRLSNVSLDGERAQRLADEKWQVRANAGGSSGSSIWPARVYGIYYNIFNINSNRVTVGNLTAKNIHCNSVIAGNSKEWDFKNLTFENISFATLVPTGSDIKSITNLDGYVADNCGQLPENFWVAEVDSTTFNYVNRDSNTYYAQGAFGARLYSKDINVNNFYTKEFGSSALVIDSQNVRANVSNVNIIHTNTFTKSNNPPAALFVELGYMISINNINVSISGRQDPNSSYGIYTYTGGTGGGTSGDNGKINTTIVTNFHIEIDDSCSVGRALYSVGNGNANFIASNGTIRTNGSYAFQSFLNYTGEGQIPNTVELSNVILEGTGNIDIRDCMSAKLTNVRDVLNGCTVQSGRYQAATATGDIEIANCKIASLSIIQAAGNVSLLNTTINNKGNTSKILGGETISEYWMKSFNIMGCIINGQTEFNGNQRKGILNIDSTIFNCPTGTGVNLLRGFRIVKFNNNIIRFNRLDAPMNISNYGTFGQVQKGNTIVRGPISTNGRGISTDVGFEAVDNDVSYDWETLG